jgi:hypothetical protein
MAGHQQLHKHRNLSQDGYGYVYLFTEQWCLHSIEMQLKRIIAIWFALQFANTLSIIIIIV